MNEIEKIEISKDHKSFYFTGLVSFSEYDVCIRTIFGEDLIFRKDQLMQRRKLKPEEINKLSEQNLDNLGLDTNERNKNI